MLSNQEYAYECLTLTAEPKMQGAQASKSIIHLFLPCHMTLNMQILYERVDRWMDGQTDRHSLLSLVGIGSQGCNELWYPGVSKSFLHSWSLQQLPHSHLLSSCWKYTKIYWPRIQSYARKTLVTLLVGKLCLCTINIWSGIGGIGINWSVGVCIITIDSAIKKGLWFF